MDAKCRGTMAALFAAFVSILGSGSVVAQDRFKLAGQSQVYLVHQTAKSNFLVQSTGYRLAAGLVADMLQAQESAQLQQKLDLRDPVNFLKDRLSEALRRELGLTNLQVLTVASDLLILPENPENLREDEREKAATRPTFKQQHPDGVVIEVVTRHWGIDNYKMKYYASVWVTDLGRSKRLMSGSCPWVIFDQVDDKKMPPRAAFDQQGKYDASAGDAYVAAMEEAIYGNKGALLKENLRKAAEQCADKIAARFK